MAKFSHYAIAAARQAINDAQWIPETDLDKERTVKKKKKATDLLDELCLIQKKKRVFVLVLEWEVWKILLTLQLLTHQA